MLDDMDVFVGVFVVFVVWVGLDGAWQWYRLRLLRIRIEELERRVPGGGA